MIPATGQPLAGFWQPTRLQGLYYGAGSVERHLLQTLPTEKSKAFIVTGNSLANKTTLIKQVERLLGDRHAGTFSQIKQHSPVQQLDEILGIILQDETIDTVLSIGGGSPCDSSKAISRLHNEKKGHYLRHVTVPTTLSAAECTGGSGLTTEEGLKKVTTDPNTAPDVIIYDSKFAVETPASLFLSTAFRALDHAMELMYHENATEVPCHAMGLQAASTIFIHLPKYKQDPEDLDTITQLQLAAFASLGFLGLNWAPPLGLSHTLGYALGSPYSIPHGVTSTLTLGHVVKLKAEDAKAAQQLARMLPFLGKSKSGDDKKDADLVGDKILQLVKDLGLATNLGNYGVGHDQAPIIAQRATGQKEGPLFEKVLELVKGLY